VSWRAGQVKCAAAPHQEQCILFGFLRRNRHERIGYALYGAAVAAARDRFHFAGLGVPDTLDGRFDMVGLHVFLVIRRLTALPPPGPAIGQAVFDAMFSDMDVNLREMGVGDLSVGRKNRAMWEAFHGRCAAYQAALGAGDATALAGVLARNVWRGGPVPAPGGEAADAALARIVMAQDAALATQGLERLRRGEVAFLAPAGLLAVAA
jgi:cytochrome b pre-mRNA-processing protein 3